MAFIMEFLGSSQLLQQSLFQAWPRSDCTTMVLVWKLLGWSHICVL